MEYFEPEDTPNFEQNECLTWGVSHKFGRYQVPIVPNEENKKMIDLICKSQKVQNPLRGKTLYLKCRDLSQKQRSELLGHGRCLILIEFSCQGVFTSPEKTRHLSFKITRLRKLDQEIEEECPLD